MFTTRRPPWNAIARLYGWNVRRLDFDDIAAAQRLLYTVYFEEGGWQPPPNPSGLRADHVQRRFLDDFDHVAAWVGLFDRAGALAGVTRVIDPQRSGGLEITRYVGMPPLAAKRIGEANRVAIRADSRGTMAVTLLSLGGAWLARSIGLQYVIGSTNERVFERAARHHGWVRLGPVFRYHPSEPAPVVMMGFDLRTQALLRFGAQRLAGTLKSVADRHRRRKTSAIRQGDPQFEGPCPAIAVGDREK